MYEITIGRTDLERLKGIYPLNELKKILNKLKKLGLIEIEMKRGKIYGFMETTLGKENLYYKEYSKWFVEYGD